MADCLVTDPMLPIERDDTTCSSASLPQVLAHLSSGTVTAFPGLAPHQRQAWYQFLVQLGAIALNRGGLDTPPGDEAVWRDLLLALAPEPGWCLVVEDFRQPAFFQPPIKEGSLKGFNRIADTPDGIDVLITAKNHDVKAFRLGAANLHHWVYALITLQTQQGFLGRGNYGVARMNGGFASRVLVDLVPSADWGERFRRGLQLAAATRNDQLALPLRFRSENGLALLWTRDWDGAESLSFDDLDPLFIEICRRVRLTRDDAGGVVAWGKPTEAARVAAKDLKGVVGDLWTPVRKKEAAALTVGPGGFRYELVADILTSPEIDPSPALSDLPDDPPGRMLLHLSVLVRGQGTTDGLYERWLPLTRAARRRLFRREDRLAVHAIAKTMIEDCRDGAKKALRVALLSLVQGGPEGDRLDFKDKRVGEAGEVLDRRIDDFFFKHLWAIVETGGDDPARVTWQRELYAAAIDVFEDWSIRLTPPSQRRERAHALAELTFTRILSKRLALLSQSNDRPEEVA
ncbi:type I-E CRISPR-associated protein Cse1/CasA [Skermanella rosea]|nr:type I-E CRISPR-associated protein Cse1/CasA [Skermanella rosea]UEM06366.1 type I-E CRISPR-associated protein Cse1/CasA [Skermanella rosea]